MAVTKIEVIRAMIRFGTVLRNIGEHQPEAQAESYVMLEAAFTSMTGLVGIDGFTFEVGETLIFEELKNAFAPTYQQAEFDADQKFILENIELIVGSISAEEIK